MSIVIGARNPAQGWGAIVCDSILIGGTGGHYRDGKVYHLNNGAIISPVGEADAAFKLMDLLNEFGSFKNIPPKCWPKTEEPDNVGALMITPELDFYRCDGQKNWFYIEDIFDTVGAAAETASGYLLACMVEGRRRFTPESLTLRAFLACAARTVAALSIIRPHAVAMPPQSAIIRL